MRFSVMEPAGLAIGGAGLAVLRQGCQGLFQGRESDGTPQILENVLWRVRPVLHLEVLVDGGGCLGLSEFCWRCFGRGFFRHLEKDCRAKADRADVCS